MATRAFTYSGINYTIEDEVAFISGTGKLTNTQNTKKVNGTSRYGIDKLNSRGYGFPVINALDIDWNSAEVEDNIVLHHTSDLLNWIKNSAGQQGEKGDTGAKGNDGKSAYELYVDSIQNGSPLSQSEWLESLKGAKGDKGDQGEQGPKGDTGSFNASDLEGYASLSYVNANYPKISYLNENYANLSYVNNNYPNLSYLNTNYAKKTDVPNIWTGSKANYDLIQDKDASTIYIILSDD